MGRGGCGFLLKGHQRLSAEVNKRDFIRLSNAGACLMYVVVIIGTNSSFYNL